MILAKTIRSFVGIYALFETAFFLKDFKFNRVYLNIGTYGMGIYILQQFVIMILYYHTAFPVLLGKFVLPWFCFTITLLASYIATYGFMHSRIGRIMIGLNPAKK